ASVKLWGRLARTARQVPLLLIGMTRPAAQRDDLLALRRAVDEDNRIQLAALPQATVAELAGTLAVTPSGTAQLAADSVPDSLPGAIADRLDFVSPPTRQVLRAAALLGVE